MERIQPQSVNDPKAYAQAIRSGSTLYLSGQVALDRDGTLVGEGNVSAQADFIWRQIGTILGEAGATYRDIVKITTYVLDMSARTALMGIRERYLGEHRAASTLVGISALARPEFLIEIEVVAEIPQKR